MIDFSELKKYKKVVIQCHDNPDADTLACAYAMSEYFKGCGQAAEIIYGGFAPVNKSNLKLMMSALGINARHIPKNGETPDYSNENNTLLMIVDGQYGAGNVKKIPAANIAVIDHHIPETPATPFTHIKPYLGSCSTLVWLLLQKEGFDFEKHTSVSTALFYGLFTDTGGLAEITHPYDMDMRDSLKYDRILVKRLKNCNLTLADLIIAGKSLTTHHINTASKNAVFEAEQCDPNILGFISDLALQVDNIDSCAVFCEVSGGIKLSVRSCAKEIMANELAGRLCEGGGSGGGHADKAGGFISAEFAGKSGLGALEFLTKRYEEYFGQYDLVYCGEYKPDISLFSEYIKLPVPIGYIRTTDIFPAGTEMTVRTLEGDSHIESGGDAYIMVGIRQEIYPIGREKFEKSYEILTGAYVPQTELFSEMHYTPEVKNRRDGSSQSIEAFIRPCVSRGAAKILARQISKRTKVFTQWNKEGYMFGKPGDWLAMRTDDHNDFYIIDNAIFQKTYKKY